MNLCLVSTKTESLDEWASVLSDSYTGQQLHIEKKLLSTDQLIYDSSPNRDAYLICEELATPTLFWLLAQPESPCAFFVGKGHGGWQVRGCTTDITAMAERLPLQAVPETVRNLPPRTLPLQAVAFCMMDLEGNIIQICPELQLPTIRNIYQLAHKDYHSALKSAFLLANRKQMPMKLQLEVHNFAIETPVVKLELYPISKEDRIMAILRGQQDPHGELWHHLLQSEELSRQKLSEELLEGLAPLLTAARMQLEGTSAAPKVETLQLLDNAINKVRTLTRSLDPHTRSHFGFFEVMTSLVNRMRHEHPALQWHLGVQPPHGPINDFVQKVAYRSLQLLLDNVLQHSQATEVWVMLSIDNHTPPMLQVAVRDNGCGMTVCDLHNHDKSCSPSFKEMASRAQLLGGKFVVESELAQGSSFVLALPCNPS